MTRPYHTAREIERVAMEERATTEFRCPSCRVPHLTKEALDAHEYRCPLGRRALRERRPNR